MRFSVKYLPTTLFSLKDSNATNSGAKSLFLPSPYAIKMAILNQAITVGGEFERLSSNNSKQFKFIRDTKINYYIEDGSYFSTNNSFVKILKPAREGGGFIQTVSFREYLYLSSPLEVIFEVDIEEQAQYLKNYLHRINYFGKRGCFFQFVEYIDSPAEANVVEFNAENIGFGLLQGYDDFEANAKFENANIFTSANAKRVQKVLVLPVIQINSSKGYCVYKKK